jgi:hypothetical protein
MLDEEEKKRAGLMSSREYNQVKTAHNHGMDPTSIAHEMNLKGQGSKHRNLIEKLWGLLGKLVVMLSLMAHDDSPLIHELPFSRMPKLIGPAFGPSDLFP